MRMRLVGLLIWVAKGDQCRTPSCVTFLPDTSGGTSETWLGSKWASTTGSVALPHMQYTCWLLQESS